MTSNHIHPRVWPEQPKDTTGSSHQSRYFSSESVHWSPLATFDIAGDLSSSRIEPDSRDSIAIDGASFEDLFAIEESGGERVCRWLGSEPFEAESMAWMTDDDAIRLTLHRPPSAPETDDLIRIAIDLARTPSSELDQAIVHSLGRIGRAAGVDRAYIFITENDEEFSNSHEWTRSGIDPQIIASMHIPQEPFQWFIDRLARDGYVVLESLDDVPADATVAREFLELQGIQSLLVVGIFHNDELSGFVGFDSVNAMKRWSPRKIERLELIAGFYVQSILHARSENELQQMNQHLRLIIQHVTDLILLVDEKSSIIFASPSSSSVIGTPKDELRGRSLLDLIHKDDRTAVARLIDADADPGADRVSVRLRHPVHGWRLTEIAASPLKENESFRGTLFVGRAIGNRETLLRQVERSTRIASLGHLASAIAHEFNNVLMGAQPFVEILRRSDDPDRRTAAIAKIAEALDRGKEISREVLRFSRPVSAEVEALDLKAWINGTEEQLRHVLSPGLEVDFDLPRDPVPVVADPELLYQCLLNLVLNSRKALENRPDGRITVSVCEPHEQLDIYGGMLEVRDNGPELSEEAREHLFEPMYMHRRNAGDGLGLSVVEKLVSAQGGAVGVESSASGTTFRLCLKRIKTSEEVLDQSHQTPRPDSNGSILLVEDDDIVASGIAAMLELEGEDVEIVRSGNEAIARMKGNRPRIVILDIGLPDMSGLEVYDVIEKTWPRLPVIFSSGHGDQQKLESLLDRPNVEFLLKPYEISTLLAVLERHTDVGH